MTKRKHYLKELQLLLSDEDLTDEKLREASEGLLPNILQFLNKKKLPKNWCIRVDVDNYGIIQKWCGTIELNYGVFVFYDKTWYNFNRFDAKEIKIKKFIKIINQWEEKN